MSRFIKMISVVALLLSIGCDIGHASGSGIQQQPSAPYRGQNYNYENYSYEVINSYPHDPAAFTQGLLFHQGVLYESTGLETASSLRQVDLTTGQVLKKIAVPSVFAEGLALFNNRLYQLTWQNQKAFVYDFATFTSLNTFNYSGEGWGLTNDGQSLIMSNGSSQIRFLDPETFQIQRTIKVTDNNGNEIDRLNELEYIKGAIFANIWLTDKIVRIDPASGKVTALINLAGLLKPEDRTRPVDVLNGIAYDETNDRLFVTGKLWPKLFQIKLIARRDAVSR